MCCRGTFCRSELFAVFELYHKQNDVHIVEVLTKIFLRAIALGFDGPVYVERLPNIARHQRFG
jgi:hypothetical protein